MTETDSNTTTTTNNNNFKSEDEYKPSSDTVALFREYTAKLNNFAAAALPQDALEALIREKMIQAHKDAMKAFPYRCVREFRFAEPRIACHSFYKDILAKDADLLSNSKIVDFGCCMGTDIRRMIADGAKPENIFGVDIQPEFIEIGFSIFNDRDTLRNRFFIANLLDNSSTVEAETDRAKFEKELGAVGGADFVYSGSVLHLLTEDLSRQLLQVAFGLISNERGGMLFGRTVCSGEEDPLDLDVAIPDPLLQKKQSQSQRQLRFLHSEKSLTKLLTEIGFTDVTTSIDKRMGMDDQKQKKGFMAFTARKQPSVSPSPARESIHSLSSQPASQRL